MMTDELKRIWRQKVENQFSFLSQIFLDELKNFQPDCTRQRQHNLHETYQLPRVQMINPDDGHRRCPKHVEFRDKMKFLILDASCWLFIRRTEEYRGKRQ
jgi:hypothetical protein